MQPMLSKQLTQQPMQKMMKSCRSYFAVFLSLTVLISQGCGTKDNRPSQAEFNADNAAFQDAQANYNLVARDETGKFTEANQIDACDKYIAHAKKMLDKYPDGRKLRDGPRTKTGGIKADLKLAQRRRAQLIAARDAKRKKIEDDQRHAEELKIGASVYEENFQTFTRDVQNFQFQMGEFRDNKPGSSDDLECLHSSVQSLISRGEALLEKRMPDPLPGEASNAKGSRVRHDVKSKAAIEAYIELLEVDLKDLNSRLKTEPTKTPDVTSPASGSVGDLSN